MQIENTEIQTHNLKVISAPGGDVMHAMKSSSKGFRGFGEAYFSVIENGLVKAWKRHKKMTLNIIVPLGKIRFVLFDDRKKKNQFKEYILSPEDYFRLTIPPMVWVGFQDLTKKKSMLLNIADIEHNPQELEKIDVDKIPYSWDLII